jgi:RHS repeat-associated protein
LGIRCPVGDLHQDQIGSTRLLTDSTGQAVGSYIYDAYGKTTSHAGSATTPLQYTGQYQDVETGFYYLRARYYDPATAQFITRDPIEALTGAPYAYTGGNPLNAIDPSGLCWSLIEGICDGFQSIRLPDYVTVDVSVIFPVYGPVGLGGGGTLTVNRHGGWYLGPSVAAGVDGVAMSVRGGWLNQKQPATSAECDQILQGPALNVNSYAPSPLGVGPSAGYTWSETAARY